MTFADKLQNDERECTCEDCSDCLLAQVRAELKETKRCLADSQKDYDMLGRFLISYLALPAGSVPRVNITPTQAYLTLMTRGTDPLKDELEKFIDFGKTFLPKPTGQGASDADGK